MLILERSTLERVLEIRKTQKRALQAKSDVLEFSNDALGRSTMHLSPKALLLPAILLVMPASLAQEIHDSDHPELMARLFYDYSGVAPQGKAQHLCFAVSHDGDYRIVRLSALGHSERLRGKMTTEQFRELTTLLKAADFRSLSGYHEGMLRQQAERFAAEIPLRGRLRLDEDPNPLEPEAWRLQWLNPDGESPFPPSVSKLVDWLRRFQPNDARPFEYTEYPDVCPSERLRFLQPSVAGNLHP